MRERRDILELAMDAELAALERYLVMTQRVNSRGTMAMFAHLAYDELVHYKILQAEVDPKRVKGTLEEARAALEKIVELLPESSRPSKTVGREHLQALKFALEQEMKAEAVYREHAEAETDESLKEIWLGLASMEKNHGEILKSQIASIEDSGFWLDVTQTWNVV